MCSLLQAFESTLKSWEDKLKYDKPPLRPHLYPQQSVDLATEEEAALLQACARAAEELITRCVECFCHPANTSLLAVIFLTYISPPFPMAGYVRQQRPMGFWSRSSLTPSTQHLTPSTKRTQNSQRSVDGFSVSLCFPHSPKRGIVKKEIPFFPPESDQTHSNRSSQYRQGSVQ